MTARPKRKKRLGHTVPNAADLEREFMRRLDEWAMVTLYRLPPGHSWRHEWGVLELVKPPRRSLGAIQWGVP